MKVIIKTCPICHGPSGDNGIYIISTENFATYISGKCIQDAWPEGSVTERETIISGICPFCQDEVFSE